MFYNRESVYYIMMSKHANNNNPTECQHPSNKIILTPEGEYICTLCGIVLTLDQAAELGAYTRPEAVGYIDPKGKTNPWLLGLGSTIPKKGKEGRRLAEIAERFDLNNDGYSKLANLIDVLSLHSYAQQIMNNFTIYNKSRRDTAVAVYIAIKDVLVKNNIPIADKDLREVINTYFNSNVKYISEHAIQRVANLASLFGAKTASKTRKKKRIKRLCNYYMKE